MSSASSAVTYTSVYTDYEPGRVFWEADGELSDGGPEHPPSPVEVPYIPEPKYPEYLVPSDDDAPMKDQPLPVDASPVALSPGYYDDDEPSDDDHDDDTGDEDEEPFDEEEDNEEEEEHLAPADSPTVHFIDPAPSAEDTEAFETNEATPTHVPSPRRHTARMSIRPQTPVPFPSRGGWRAEEVGYGIKDVWVDPTEIVEEVAPTTLEEVNDRVTELAAVQEQDTQDIYGIIEDTYDRQTRIYQRVDILAEDKQINVSPHRIQALQARDQTHADDREGAGSSA
ncbi:hypothetical protein Tco_0446168 [Tanacetum coccineum]